MKNMIACGICDHQFQFGPGSYDGTHLPYYQMTICRICYAANWDGFGPNAEDKLK